ncbi:uncharacterized protein [Watersipora subatra]|uniref:uncharacterized protein isoform X2 n=1 Tax=Watersipora subatra TaxID=2589382 RepID=UPI00355BD4F4
MFDSFNPFIDTSSKRINLWIHGNSITCDCHHIYLRNTNWFSIREYINCSGKSANLLNFNAEACQNPTYVKGCPNKCPTECDCLGHFTGEVCSEPTSCAAMHCSYYHNCISHPSTGKPTCVEDLLYSRVRYGNRKRESCSSSPDCQYHLKDSVCNTYSENCECPPNTVAHDNKCVPMWVPCKAEMQCILFTFTAQCDGRPLNDLGDAMYHNRMPLLSESDCLCYLYAKSENERESCTGYRLRESSKPSAYIAKNGLGILDQEYLLPLVLGVLSILGNMTLCMIRRTRRKAKAKRKEDHKRYKEMRKEHLHDLASSLPVTIPNVEETNNSKASKISKRRDSFKSVISTKKRPKSLINKTQLEETN